MTTLLDVNSFVTNAVLPEINTLVSNHLEFEYNYISSEDDVEDLENAELSDELYDDIKKDLIKLYKESQEDYDFSKVELKEFPDDELHSIIESSFSDYIDLMKERYYDLFDRQEYLDEYYSDNELEF